MTRPRSIRTTRWLVAAVTLAVTAVVVGQERYIGGPRVLVTFPAELSKTAVDGRLLLMISSDDGAEPRFQISDGPRTQQVFGIDVDGWKPGDAGTFDGAVLGYPLESACATLPAGHLHGAGAAAQVRDVHALATATPSSCRWTAAKASSGTARPATSTARRRRSRSSREGRRADRDRARPGDPADPAADGHEYVKHVRIQSERLSKFWGRDMYLGAHVLLPEGFDTHPDARYPLVINHGHFPHDLGGLRETPPDPNLKCEYSASASTSTCYNRIAAGARARLLQGVDRPELPARAGHRDPARQPVLRRLLRGELGEPRPVRRRDHVRARAAHREELPRHRRRAGRASCTAGRRAAGRRWPCRCSTRTTSTAPTRVPRPDRLPRLHRRRHLQGHERVLRSTARRKRRRGPATATTSATSTRRSSR